MKTRVVTALIALIVGGCGPGVRDSTQTLQEPKPTVEPPIRSEATDGPSSLVDGGQPGLVVINGVLDERIKVEQKGGRNLDGTDTPVSDALKAVFSTDTSRLDLSDVVASRNYINIGCETLSGAETANLSEQTSAESRDRVLYLNAKKIFICGSRMFNKSLHFVNLKGDEIVLKAVTLTIEPVTTGLSLSARRLILEGENLIETRGPRSSEPLEPGPSLHLNVTEEIQGEGTLILRTIGGDRVTENR